MTYTHHNDNDEHTIEDPDGDILKFFDYTTDPQQPRGYIGFLAKGATAGVYLTKDDAVALARALLDAAARKRNPI